jgi:signal transduction histidine kinase
MTPNDPRLISSETFDPEPTSSRLLAELSAPLRLFVMMTLTFSILGGLLQVLGSTRGPLARTLSTAITVHIAGNLIASGTAIALVLLVRRMNGTSRYVSVRAAAAGGAIGGAARLPVEVLAGAELNVRDAVASVVTEGGWFLIAALATNMIARLARNERDTRHALAEALRRQTLMRTQMLNADLQTRRDVAEWLHGHLQSELLLAADAARRIGPEGETLAARLAQLRDDDLRDFAHSLHPTLAELNLSGALQVLVRRYASSTSVVLRTDAATARGELPASVAVAAYRTCEEAVANAVKHGGARQVDITIDRDAEAGTLTLVIADDGTGTAGDLEPGLGLALVDTYVRTVGGTWDLRFGVDALTSDGACASAGATLTVTIPLTPTPLTPATISPTAS